MKGDREHQSPLLLRYIIEQKKNSRYENPHVLLLVLNGLLVHDLDGDQAVLFDVL